jgi:3-hydroxybutyryl-CoA dehydrogenase
MTRSDGECMPSWGGRVANAGDQIVVVGGGTMGTVIAAAFFASGDRVTSSRTQGDGSRVAGRSARSSTTAWTAASSTWLEPMPSREAYSSSLRSMRRRIGPALVVEAVPERVALTRTVLAAAEQLHPTVLASNTSSLSIDGLATSLSNPGALLGMHFFNPVAAMALVEVVRRSATSQPTLERALDMVRRIGKEPIVVRDPPGFASSRLGVAPGSRRCGWWRRAWRSLRGSTG